MSDSYICDGQKYKCGYGAIYLPITLPTLPKTVEINNVKLTLKTAFHISLVCIGSMIEKEKISPDLENKIKDDFCQFAVSNTMSELRFTGEYRFVRQNERKSVIAMCEVSNLNLFFDFINKKYEINLEYPPTHATLYTLQPDIGIFVADSEDIVLLTEVVDLSLNLAS